MATTAPTASVVAPTKQEPTAAVAITMNGSDSGSAPSVTQTPVPLPIPPSRSSVSSSSSKQSSIASPALTTTSAAVADVDGGKSESGPTSATPQSQQPKAQAQYASPNLPLSVPPTKNGIVVSQVPSSAASSSTAVVAPVPAPAVASGVAPSQKTKGSTFQSPTAVSDASKSVEFQGAYNDLKNKITETNPTVVRQVIRDQWQKCLVGSDFHTTFLANATFHHAPVTVLGKVIGDFGEKAVKHARHQVIKHLSKTDLDDLVDDILSKASNRFMDRVVARRLETIGAQDLVNALARAERLGYDAGDIVEGGKPGRSRDEHVIPSMHPVAQQPMPQYQAPPYHRPQHQAPQHLVPHYQVPPPHPHHPPPQIQPHPSYNQSPSAPSLRPLPPASRLIPNPVPFKLPPGIVACQLCNRPCSSDKALQHHHKKADCQNTSFHQFTGNEACIHCGSHFTGVGGLSYHVKSQVCGVYSHDARELIASMVQYYVTAQSQPRPQSKPQLLPQHPPQHPSQHPSQHQSQHQPQATVIPSPSGNGFTTPVPSRVQAAKPSPSPVPGGDAYAHLTEARRQSFESEMKRAEEKYGKLMREAMRLPAIEQADRLAKLKNSYNTKQSTTRKKYGIRLRERRTYAEIEAEQQRLLGIPSGEINEQPTKKARISSDGQAVTTQAYSPSPTDSPHRRVPVGEMGGGLNGSSATAELVDPTSSLTPSQRHRSEENQVSKDTLAATNQGTSDDPMQIDDSSGNSDSDSNEDIPARLP